MKLQIRSTGSAVHPLMRAPRRPLHLYTPGAASFQNHREPSLTGTGEGAARRWGGRGRRPPATPRGGGVDPLAANSSPPRQPSVRARVSRRRLPWSPRSGRGWVLRMGRRLNERARAPHLSNRRLGRGGWAEGGGGSVAGERMRGGRPGWRLGARGAEGEGSVGGFAQAAGDVIRCPTPLRTS